MNKKKKQSPEGDDQPSKKFKKASSEEKSSKTSCEERLHDSSKSSSGGKKAEPTKKMPGSAYAYGKWQSAKEKTDDTTEEVKDHRTRSRSRAVPESEKVDDGSTVEETDRPPRTSGTFRKRQYGTNEADYPATSKNKRQDADAPEASKHSRERQRATSPAKLPSAVYAYGRWQSTTDGTDTVQDKTSRLSTDKPRSRPSSEEDDCMIVLDDNRRTFEKESRTSRRNGDQGDRHRDGKITHKQAASYGVGPDEGLSRAARKRKRRRDKDRQPQESVPERDRRPDPDGGGRDGNADTAREHRNGARNHNLRDQYGRRYIQDRIFQYPNSDQALVLLHHQEEVTLRGKVKVRCLQGSVSIFGCVLTHNTSAAVPVYSPESSALLTVTTLSAMMQVRRGWRDELTKLPAAEDEINTILRHHACAVLLLDRLDSSMLDFLTGFNPFQGLFTGSKADASNAFNPLSKLDVQIMADPSVHKFNIPKSYWDLGHVLMDRVRQGDQPVVAVCGGKSVGKSSLCRYLLNCLLYYMPEVAYLECDIGQTEFTPPACISLTRVHKPLIGPSFTHQQRSDRSCFVGGVTPADDPVHYMRCLDYVHQDYRERSTKCPLVVNTMGWNKGLGLSFLAETIHLIQADFVVQLNSQNARLNLPTLSASFITEHLGELHGWVPRTLKEGKDAEGEEEEEEEEEEEPKYHQLISIASPVYSQFDSRYSPPDHRALALLAYLGQMCPASSGSGTTTPVTLTSVQPYEVPWESVAVHACHATVSNSHVLYALNGSVVALCQLPEDQMLKSGLPGLPSFLADNPVCSCLGLGIVRSIDPLKKLFHIITPVPPGELRKVNCLLRGNLALPQQAFMKQKSLTGDLPYVDFPKDVAGATSVRRRRHMLRHRPSAGST